ncbi:4'-phosphopantetheinyl transferase [Paraburkholderia bannensis]|uniref:4'-phosphopantetheinyl transferase n=1 Tax=Paraburkholderia bannensis TaxID=765414 RepID=A0A7W9WT00_9BURK|nr:MULTISPECIES: 4'-phosphopantetheinyl transferase superfamily protein [Paraburkholderia]MBB3257763.1 4'-phosphopantetheinyl transferase [Paraburkholderia sp. WP4_3_2]MBB6102776.1 4'-phosphopantetheinyl transferase [Paraburkholderia bannensis]
MTHPLNDSARRLRVYANGRWPDDIDVWHLHFDFDNASPDSMPFLDATERAKAARYVRLADQVRFAATRSALRALLGEALKMDPRDVPLVVSERGKPMLADTSGGAISFNVSHSGDHALIVLSQRRGVGVDIERIDEAIDWRGLARLVCTPEERQAIEGAPHALQPAHFFRCWTAKEALLKTLGLGITEGLQALRVDLCVQTPGAFPAPPQVLKDVHGCVGARALQYRWIEEIDGFFGCLAFEPIRPA